MLGELLGLSAFSAFEIIKDAAAISLIGASTYGLVKYANEKGENKICDYTEIKDLFGDGIQCSKNVRLNVALSTQHVLITAYSGWGKTSGLIAPNINQLKNCSIIATDPDCTIKKRCHPNKLEFCLNPFDKKSIGYNPLANCKDEFEVRKLVEIIVENGRNLSDGTQSNSNHEEWINYTKPLLRAYMIMNFHTKQFTFAEMINRLCTLPLLGRRETINGVKCITEESVDGDILASGVENAIKEFKGFEPIKDAPGMMSSVRTILNSILQPFMDSNVIQNIYQKENFDLSLLRKKECVLYIQIPERHSKYFRPFVATFLVQLFDILIDNYDDGKGLQTFCLIDEWCNIGKIPDMDVLLATCRRSTIGICCAIQNLPQLVSLYGESYKKYIEFFRTLIVTGGSYDNDFISKLMGKTHFKEKDMLREKALMESDEIRRLEDEEVLIITKNKRIVKDYRLELIINRGTNNAATH